MRLWTLHPRYLDRQGLVALWREALLARAVLRGRTRGYTRHPQLERFRAHPAPRRAISAYLAVVHAEAEARGYLFDRTKIGPLCEVARIPATTGQIAHEWAHLLAKVGRRSPEHVARLRAVGFPECHPLFVAVAGPMEPWERRYDAEARREAARRDAPDAQARREAARRDAPSAGRDPAVDLPPLRRARRRR